VVINVVNYGTTVVTQVVDSIIKIRGLKFRIQALVLPSVLPNAQVLLGADWLTAHKVQLDYGARVARVYTSRGQSKSLQPNPAEGFCCKVAALKALRADPQFLSAKQVAKAMRNDCRTWLMLVQAEAVGTASVGAALFGDTLKQPEHSAVLQEYQDVFAPLSELPPVREIAHTINLQPGATPPFRKSYRMSPAEQKEVERQVAELLKLGYIEPSTSPYGAPVLFVQKKDGSLRMCVDYRQLNKITIRDRYPLPRIDDLIDKLTHARVYSCFDMASGYNQFRIPESDVPKTAFTTHIGHFQYKVLSFGLTNAPATFQRAMNHIFRDCIGKFVFCYFDDLLVASETLEQHEQHLRHVLALFRKNKLFAKRSKCEFYQTHVKFLGHIVGGGTVSVDPAKTAVVQNWPRPKSLKELRGFLGLCNYFRKFVRGYSTIAAPLTALTSEKVVFDWNNWTEEAATAFSHLKSVLTSLRRSEIGVTFNFVTLELDQTLLGSLPIRMSIANP
jgi:hypothetical protein